MPLELGIYLGCKKFGGGKHRSKGCLILEKERYRYQKFISDIAGQDISFHENNPNIALQKVRDWLRTESKRISILGGAKIYERYAHFENILKTRSYGL